MKLANTLNLHSARLHIKELVAFLHEHFLCFLWALCKP